MTNRFSILRAVRRAFGVAVSGLVLFLGVRGVWIAAAGPGPAGRTWDDRTAAQLRFLSATEVGIDGEIVDRLPDRADAMQRLFPEGRLYTLALTGLAWHHLAERRVVDPVTARDEVGLILSFATDEATTRTFGLASGLPHGMFYEAWTTQLRLAAARDVGATDDDLAASCRRLDAALGGPALFPESYPGQAWPADAVVGASALAQCGAVDPVHAQTARRWLARVRERLDPETGLIPHEAVRPDARGSSTALMIPFLADIDLAFARDQYQRFDAHFGTRLLGVAPTVREYPHGQSGQGDIDSGPVVWGVSAPASVVGIAAARAVGDADAAQALRATVEAAGLPLDWRGKRSYALGRLPVGDAFLAWASSRPLAEAPETPHPWRGRWVGASLLLVAIGGWGLRRVGRRPA